MCAVRDKEHRRGGLSGPARIANGRIGLRLAFAAPLMVLILRDCAAFAVEIITDGRLIITDGRLSEEQRNVKTHTLTFENAEAHLRWIWDGQPKGIGKAGAEQVKSVQLKPGDQVKIDLPSAAKDELDGKSLRTIARSGLLNSWYAKHVRFEFSLGGKEVEMTLLAVENYDGNHNENNATYCLDGARADTWDVAKTLLSEIRTEGRLLLVLVPWKSTPSGPAYRLPQGLSRQLDKLRKAGMHVMVCEDVTW